MINLPLREQQILASKSSDTELLREMFLVRYLWPQLCVNPSTPVDFLRTMSSQDPVCFWLSSCNPNTPEDILRAVFRAGRDADERLAGNPSTPPTVLRAIARRNRKHPWILSLVICNPNTPRNLGFSLAMGLPGHWQELLICVKGVPDSIRIALSMDSI